MTAIETNIIQFMCRIDNRGIGCTHENFCSVNPGVDEALVHAVMVDMIKDGLIRHTGCGFYMLGRKSDETGMIRNLQVELAAAQAENKRLRAELEKLRQELRRDVHHEHYVCVA